MSLLLPLKVPTKPLLRRRRRVSPRPRRRTVRTMMETRPKVKVETLPRRRRRREVRKDDGTNQSVDKKKKKATGDTLGGHVLAPRAQDNSHIRLLGDWKAEGKVPFRQSYPQMIPIAQQFPDGKYPEGEIVEY